MTITCSPLRDLPGGKASDAPGKVLPPHSSKERCKPDPNILQMGLSELPWNLPRVMGLDPEAPTCLVTLCQGTEQWNALPQTHDPSGLPSAH